MNTLTIEIPDALESALHEISARRHLPESVVAREILEQTLMPKPWSSSAVELWLSQWRGQLKINESATLGDDRLSHLLNKHLR
jgi:predicted transcriptional regulator